jgi:uncharacterized protein
VVTARRPSRGGRPRAPAAAPLGEREIDELEALLESVPAPLEPLDVVALDGFLCGVLVQPEAVPAQRWLPFVTDLDGRALPAAFDARRLQALTLRREAELRGAIGRREWFDPWVFELDDEAPAAAVEAVHPWAAGFAAAFETFPGLLAVDDAAVTEPLALIYRHLGADELDDAEALLAEIESLEPPADLAAAVEELVRATLLLADAAGVPRQR